MGQFALSPLRARIAASDGDPTLALAVYRASVGWRTAVPSDGATIVRSSERDKPAMEVGTMPDSLRKIRVAPRDGPIGGGVAA